MLDIIMILIGGVSTGGLILLVDWCQKQIEQKD